MLGGEFARSMGPIVVLAAISLWGKDRVYFLLPAAFIYSLLIILMLYKNSEKSDNTEKHHEKSFLNVLKDMKFFFVSVGMILLARTSISSVLYTYLPSYLTDKGLSLWFSGISLSVLQLAGAAGVMFSGFISDRIGRNKTLLISTLISPVLMLAFTMSGGITAIILLIATGFAGFASYPVLLAYVQEQSGKNPTVCSSVFMTIDFLIVTITITAAGFLGDNFGLQTSFIISGFVSFCGFPFVLLLRKKLKRQIIN